MLLCGVVYPSLYEARRVYKSGFSKYLSSFAHISDMIYILGGFTNVMLQKFGNPFHISSKVCLTLILMQQLKKTFFFLRLFDNLSYLVTMLNTVLYDLRVFLLFYFILVGLFSMIFSVLGTANEKIEGSFKKHYDRIQLAADPNTITLYTGSEYKMIGKIMGNFFTTLRLSLGDFDFDASTFMQTRENFLYWVVWFIMVIMTCIVFLNFIIAEASASYSTVKDRLEAMVTLEKASLCAEAEVMILHKLKDDKRFPKYIIIR